MFPRLIALALALLSAPAAAQSIPAIGSDADACAPDANETALRVEITGFKDRKGQVRLEIYSTDPGEFLGNSRKLVEGGKVFRRIDAPTPQAGAVYSCIRLPGPGTYTLAVLHDRNLNGKFSLFTDGVGFPNRARRIYRKPTVAEAEFTATAGLNTMTVPLFYP